MGSGLGSAAKYRADLNEVVASATSIDDEKVISELKSKVEEVKLFVQGNERSQEKAPDLMADLLDNLGGASKIKDMKAKSQKLIATVDASIPQNPRFFEQHLIYEGTGLEKLIADGRMVKPIFDDFCEKVCKAWMTQFDLSCHFVNAGIKSLRRSEVKVRVDYNGKVTKLKDVVRGTICVDCKPGLCTLEQVYDSLQYLVENAGEILSGVRVQVIKVKDRYQCPSGRYHDFALTIKMRNFICELQVNFSAALDHKEAKEHSKYELDRLGKANLLDACMRDDATAVKLMLSTGVGIKGLKDSNDCTPLAYASVHANLEMVEALLQHGADPLAIDSSGWMPVHYALNQGAVKVAALIFDYMLTLDLSDSPLFVGPALCATWSMVLADPAMEFLGKQAWSLFDLQKPNNNVKLTYAASLADVRACERILELRGDPNLGILLDTATGISGTTLDWAVLSGAPADLVDLLIKHGAYYLREGGPLHDPQAAALEYAAKDQDAKLRVLFQLEDLRANLRSFRGASSVVWGSPQWPGTPLCKHELVKTAAVWQSKKFIRRMIQDGLVLSEGDKTLEKQLFAAVSTGDFEFAGLLLDLGVDANASDSEISLLSCAVIVGHMDMCEFLVERGSDVNAASAPLFYTPTHYAAMHGRCNILRFLHEVGADFNAKNVESKTPEGVARKAGKTKAENLIKKLTTRDPCESDT